MTVGWPGSADTTTIQRRPVHCENLRPRSPISTFDARRLERDLEPAVLEADQPHVALERGLGLQVAHLGGERDQILEAVDARAPAGRRSCPGCSHRRDDCSRRQRQRRARSAARKVGARLRRSTRAPGRRCGRRRADVQFARRSRPRLAIVLGQPADDIVGRRQVGGVGEAHQHHFGGRERPVGALHFGQALEQHLPGAREDAHRQRRREGAAARALGLGQRAVVGGGGHDLHARDEMGELGKVGDDHGRIGADVVLIAQSVSAACGVAAHQRLEQVDDARAVGKAEHLAHILGAHRARRMRDRLIEQRQRVAHRAFGGAGDQRERFRLDRDRLPWRRCLEMRDQHVRLDAAQIEALAARQDGDRDLADFGGGENELHVRRRLFQRLQQRVEGRVDSMCTSSMM